MEHFIFCYDIAQPGRLQRMEKIAESFGNRLQDSVFECLLDPKDTVRFRARVEKLIVKSEDSVIYIRLCAACGRGIEHIGVRKAPPVEATEFIV
ncbi:MAG: CRISPR-associated endonuclease Cas2 [Armatimonadetes bacterium]|nr:CRISPR-associated endonuclease Cas2 [Armatimonadota bacterium]